ncbi:MAG TPA: GNAT family N-acetyltransferase [Micromonosporaceae bacterium]
MATGRIVDLQLRDGGWIHVRPIQPSDADGLVDLHTRMSERTRYFRFFGAYPRMPSADRQRFVTVDHRNREALVAVLDNDLIAVARYERLASATDAEVAFVVADAHQRRGIAPALLGRLVLAAQEAGIARFVAEVLPGNAPMMRVFARAGFEIEHEYADGVIHVAFSINEKQQASDLP